MKLLKKPLKTFKKHHEVKPKVISNDSKSLPKIVNIPKFLKTSFLVDGNEHINSIYYYIDDEGILYLGTPVMIIACNSNAFERFKNCNMIEDIKVYNAYKTCKDKLEKSKFYSMGRITNFYVKIQNKLVTFITSNKKVISVNSSILDALDLEVYYEIYIGDQLEPIFIDTFDYVAYIMPVRHNITNIESDVIEVLSKYHNSTKDDNEGNTFINPNVCNENYVSLGYEIEDDDLPF